MGLGFSRPLAGFNHLDQPSVVLSIRFVACWQLLYGLFCDIPGLFACLYSFFIGRESHDTDLVKESRSEAQYYSLDGLSFCRSWWAYSFWTLVLVSMSPLCESVSLPFKIKGDFASYTGLRAMTRTLLSFHIVAFSLPPFLVVFHSVHFSL